MGLDAPTGTFAQLCDELVDLPIEHTDLAYEGMVWNVRRDRVNLGAAGSVTREYLEHTGAVLVVALREAADSPEGTDDILLIRQYRHPVRSFLWELPAGLLDLAGEPPWEAAARELAEEADLIAGRWHVLADSYASPGGMTEVIRIYLARDLTSAALTHAREGEEAGIRPLWVPLDAAYAAVLAGRVHNAGAMIGILAAWGSRALAWETLRPADAPWPEHPAYRI
ncbi:MAG: NUDIX hydrolase [Actinomycetales bacterium]|nr:NUDIX hydrolase [Actinomycetales bacterium]